MDGALFLAAKKGDIKTLEQHGVISEVTFGGNNILHIAAREGHSHVVEWILQRRPALALSGNNDKNTPLHEAAKNGDNGGVVKLLLQYSKRPASRSNRFGETPLVIAADYGHADAAKLLLDATLLCMVFWPRDDQKTCLATAAYGGHLEVVKLILRDRPTCFNILHLILFIKDAFGATPLHAAVHSGHKETVSEILSTSSKLSNSIQRWDKSLMAKKDKYGRCAVHIAAMVGNVEIVDLFMTSKPDCVEIRSDCRKTALHWAVEYNQIGAVRRLLQDNKEDVNAKLVSYDSDMNGNTPLHLGAMNGVDRELMAYLLSFSGVYPDAINDEGLTALNIAGKFKKEPNFATIATILENASAIPRLVVVVPPQRGSDEGIHPKEEGFKMPDVDTLVASLIATVTFSAIFQVPGDFDEDKGVARLSLTAVFNVFLFSNCLGFFASMSVVLAWIFRERLPTKLVLHRSALGILSMVGLTISVISTSLAFFCATALVTIPRKFDKKYEKGHAKFDPKMSNEMFTNRQKHQYEKLFSGEILTAFVVPSFALVFLSIAWLLQYNFNATNARQAELKSQLKRVVILTIPVATITLVILFILVVKSVTRNIDGR